MTYNERIPKCDEVETERLDDGARLTASFVGEGERVLDAMCANGSFADLLRLRAEDNAPRVKSVIMVLLVGGPSHIDMYDLKPDAPVEFRGEFKPIATKAPGMSLCELLPRQAQIADRLTIIRNLKFSGDNHSGEELTTVIMRTVGTPKSVVDRYKAAIAGD